MHWVLIFVLMCGNNVSMTNISGFSTEMLCESAGDMASNSVDSFSSSEKYSCIQVQ